MKVLKSYLDGAAVIGWESGNVVLKLDGSVGGGKAAGFISGQATVKIAAVEEIEKLGEAEINALVAQHEPAFLPFVQAVEAYANAGLAALG